MGARFIVGDALAVLRTMPDASVDLVLTSPPFLCLRSYLSEDDPAKAQEMGSEATPGAYLDALLDVVEECRRVLAPHGSLCVELGDTFSGSGGAGGDYNEGGLRDGQARFDGSASRAYGTGAAARPARVGREKAKNHRYNQPDGAPRTGPGRWTGERDGWPIDKSLCLVPETFRFALVYGFNPFTRRETPRWRARNVVRWCRPNPPVGALGDKFRPATTEMVVACVSRDRYFDLDAVRTPLTEPDRAFRHQDDPNPRHGWEGQTEGFRQNGGGAPPLDHWLIPTQPFKGAHYAVFPEALCVRPIEAMCPRRVCTVCGQPSERIAQTTNAVGHAVQRRAHFASPEGAGDGRVGVPDVNTAPDYAERRTLGWTDCGCEGGEGRWRKGMVLDPFCGSGTTLSVATGHGRDAIGIDLDERNLWLARERVGMFLEADFFKDEEETSWAT